MLFTYVSTYFIVTIACFLIGIVYLYQLSSDFGSITSVNAFRMFIFFYLVFVATNMIWIWGNNGYIRFFGTPNSMINLFSICMASFYWFRYVESRLNPEQKVSRKFTVISLIPLGMALILIVTSPMTKLVFYYADGEYMHGPLYSTMFILAVVYLLYASTHILLRLRTTRTKAQKSEYRMLAMFTLFPMAAGLIDIFVPNLPVMELALLYALCIVYSTIQRSQIYIDSLTRINNRRRADEYIGEKLSQASVKKPLYLFIGDVNGFKRINDEYGHIEGDKALKIFAETFRIYADKVNAFTARWGGDEFVLLVQGSEDFDPEEVITGIDRELAAQSEGENLPFEVGITMGYCKCTDPKVSIDALVRSADEMMYRRKEGRSENS